MNEETLFEAAISRSPEDRAGFLEQACEGRPELRAAVLALLAAHEKSGNMLDSPPAQTVETGPGQPREPDTSDHTPDPDDASLPVTKTADYSPMSVPGIVIAGRYTLQEKIGEGGMGEVWVAKQTEPVKRKVALKLIKTGMDSKAVLHRFEQERQALALMDHPNISKVLDGGLTPTGQPFFVMELVNGLPLTKFCDEAGLTTKERLELFVPICQAVQHAHQKGIVHRDLKPANILVTMIDGKPVPKIIDFGVAKATAGKLTDASLSTQFGAVIGTLEYMSPEQAGFSGEDIDTRSDIYSLGVVLYELMTGLRPIDANRLRKAALTEMIRIIREEEPSKPSTRLSTDESLASMAALRQTDPRKLMALLRGELDWVVMKCLEKHRERRYETASGLARDVERYLADEAVEARPPSARYRFGKFLKRHRGAVIAASLVLLSLLGGLAAVAAVQTAANARLAAALARETKANAALNDANDQLTKSRAAVQARYELATDAIKTFHTGVSEDFLLKEEQFKALRDRLLKSAADFYGKLGALLGNETDLASRRALAASNFELANLTDKVGRKEDAIAAHRAVLGAREALAAMPGADATAMADVGRSLNALALLLHVTGKSDESLAAYRRSESLLANVAGSDPAARAELTDCRSRLGYLLVTRLEPAEALATYRLALSDQEALAAAPGAAKEIQRDLSETILRTAFLLRDIGKQSEAEAEFRHGITLKQKLADEHPDVAELRSGLALSHVGFGATLKALGKISEAEAEIHRGIALFQRLVDDNPAVTDFRSRLAFSHGHLGRVLMAMGKPTKAEAEFRTAIALYGKLVEDNDDVTEFRRFLAASHMDLGFLLSQTGKPSQGEPEYGRAIVLLQKLSDDNRASSQFRMDLAQSHSALGAFLRATGRPAKAVASFRSAVAAMERLERLADVDLYNLACYLALLAGTAKVHSSGVSAAEGWGWADRAMETLSRAVAAGYRDLARMRTDTDLDSLRDREDFQLLMMDLAMPADPFIR